MGRNNALKYESTVYWASMRIETCFPVKFTSEIKFELKSRGQKHACVVRFGSPSRTFYFRMKSRSMLTWTPIYLLTPVIVNTLANANYVKMGNYTF
jgi:hypothetical protein